MNTDIYRITDTAKGLGIQQFCMEVKLPEEVIEELFEGYGEWNGEEVTILTNSEEILKSAEGDGQ